MKDTPARRRLPTLRWAASAGIAILMALGQAGPAVAGAKVPGTKCPLFPDNGYWQARVDRLKVHKRSTQWMSNMSPDRDLHPDFGPSYGAQSVPYGIPITIVDSGHKTVRVTFDFADESDNVRYPLGNDTKVEGGQWEDGDRHTVVVNKDNCRLYETWATVKDGNRWSAGSGATWKLESNKLRPYDWTSADAAGLPILPGLLSYGEVKRGKIRHAVRFTTNVTDRTFVWPARHHAGSVDNRAYPPMGARFRLKKSFKIDKSLRKDTRAILKAFKKYGLVLADNGSPWYFQGTQDKRWPDGLLNELKAVPASAFEAVNTKPMKVRSNSFKVKKRYRN